MGAGFEGEGEGVEVRGEGKAAKGSEEVEGWERGGEEGVGSDEVVEGEGGGVWDEVEERGGVGE